jgi:hypothetical protein
MGETGYPAAGFSLLNHHLPTNPGSRLFGCSVFHRQPESTSTSRIHKKYFLAG